MHSRSWFIRKFLKKIIKLKNNFLPVVEKRELQDSTVQLNNILKLSMFLGDSHPTLNLIVKADVDGTLEAILDTLDTYESTDCKMELVHYGVGPVTPNDVELAETFNAVIYVFNTECTPSLEEELAKAGIALKRHNVIYKLIDDVKEEINKRLPPKEVEEILGEASVLQQFDINEGRRKIPVAGCRCVKGVLKRSGSYRLVRNGVVIYDGKYNS